MEQTLSFAAQCCDTNHALARTLMETCCARKCTQNMGPLQKDAPSIDYYRQFLLLLLLLILICPLLKQTTFTCFKIVISNMFTCFSSKAKANKI